jgi:hypothetical protein
MEDAEEVVRNPANDTAVKHERAVKDAYRSRGKPSSQGFDFEIHAIRRI